MIFEAGLGFQVSGLNPGGELVISGTGGLFAKDKPLGTDITTDDFHLVLLDTAVNAEFDENGFSIALDRGTLLLPTFFENSFCTNALNAAFAPPLPFAAASSETSERASISLSPDTPLFISYQSNPGQVSFAGSLLFENIGLSVPGIDGLEATLCEATLTFQDDQLPRLENANGVIQIPLPDDVAILELQNAEWDLNGFPTGKIQLNDNVTLFEEGGFEFVVLGATSEGCEESGFAIRETGGDVEFLLEGGAELRVPLDALSDQDGDAIALAACGSLQILNGELPLLTVDSASLEGNFRIGGENGAQISNARVTVENLDQLLDPDGGGEPFRLIVESGRLELANGAFFQVNRGEIASDGSFLLDAEAGSGSGLDYAGVNIAANVFVTGDATGSFILEGSGELTLIESGQRFAVAVGYDHAAAELSFASETQGLDLRFSDDFVIFDAGFGFAVSGSEQSGQMQIAGSAGLVATSPLGETIDRSQFQLIVDQVSSTLAFDANGFTLSLDQGTLSLPEIFETGLCDENGELANDSGAQIALNPDRPIFVDYDFAENRVTFGGEIEFTDIGFSVPDIDDFSVSVCRAVLTFSDNQLPMLSEVFATMQIPLPDDSALVDVENASWSLDGFPIGTIALREDVALFNAGGFSLSVVGQENEFCPEGTALTIEANGGQPFFRLDGGMRFVAPADVITDDQGGELFAQFCAGVDFAFNSFPVLEIDTLSIGSGGDLRLGGTDGLVIKEASLTAEDIQNLFNQSPDTPFVIRLSGGFEIPDGPGFALQNAKFTFIGEDLPIFSIGGATLSTGDTFEAAAGLPLQLSDAGFTFKEQELPLPDLLYPENLVITLGASLGLPPEQPVVSGQVQGLTVTLEDGVPVVQVSGIGLGIENFEIPPLSLTGQVFIGGLGPDEDIYFAGNVGGSLNGAGVNALLAFNLQGPLGCCFGINAGPGGIPLGQTGILFTGAEGGVSFLNTNGDPCDFQTFINVDPDSGRPMSNPETVELALLENRLSGGTSPDKSDHPRIGEMHTMTWDELRAMQERAEIYRAAEAANVLSADSNSRTKSYDSSPALLSDIQVLGESGSLFAAEAPPEIPCPTGECPPETVNILCQPHPDFERYPDRIIVKFSSLDEAFLNDIGITRQYLESLGLSTAEEIAAEVAHQLRLAVEVITPRPERTFVGPNGEPLGEEINDIIDQALDGVETAFAGSIQSAIQGVLGDSESVYDAIIEAAYAGVKCPDATVKLTGTFTHLTVSSFLSGTGGVVLSTTGSAGLVGTVNLFGIPVGFLDGFVNATDAQGDPNPSMCGVVRMAVGPLELGGLRALYECPQCVTGVLNAFVDMADCLAQDIIDAILPKVAPHLVGLTNEEAFNQMTDNERVAFIAELFSLPPSAGAADCFLNLVINSVESINPSLSLCGEVRPKLFGFALTEAAVEVRAGADKSSMAAGFAMTPSLMINAIFAVLPTVDQASMGFALSWPNPEELIVGGLTGQFSTPDAIAAYIEESFEYMLENATYTVGYEFSPFGFKGFQSGARIVMPNLTAHPEISGWIPPEDRGLPSRLELMLAAVENDYLANPLWKGTAEDLHQVFPEGDTRRNQVTGLSFSQDYFPHGGIVGAARLGLPRAIIDAPPESLSTIFNPDADIFARLTAALDYLQNYVLFSSEVGTLGFYVPAPNPPLFTDPSGDSLQPKELLDAIMTFDPTQVSAIDTISIEHAFMQGYLDGQLLGIPIARAEVSAEPPTDTASGRFFVSTEIPDGSWMQSFVDNASMTFEITQPPQSRIEERFTEVASQIQTAIDNGGTSEAENVVSDLQDALFSDLPKAALDLQVNNLRIPDALEPILSLDGSTSASFVAYSPRFDPDADGDNPLAYARRYGGVGLQARLRIADLVTIDNAELAIFPGTLSALTGLPAMAGRFDVPELPVVAGLTLQNALLDFNSEPLVGDAFIAASGNIDPISIQPLMEIVPLNEGQTLLGGALSITRIQGGGASLPSLSIDPSRVSLPAFVEGISVSIFGATENDPFTFSPEEDWSATTRIEGGLRLRDAFGTEVLRLGSDTQSFTAAISGTGLESATISLTVPTGIEVTAFPGLAVEQSFAIGNADGADATLTISSDATFELTGSLESNLSFVGLPVSQINAGASIRLTESSLALTGNVSGGGLDGAGAGSAEATIQVDKNGIALNGAVVLTPLQFGVFRILGVDGGNLSAVFDNESLRVDSGAQLAVQGLADDLLILNEFVIEPDGDFIVSVSSGDFAIPGYFALSGGSSVLQSVSGVVSFEASAPTATLLPGSGFDTQLPTALETLVIESNGRIYYDSGTQSINLPHTFTASGRLEFGYEPDANAPLLAVDASPIQFGLVDTGQSATQTIEVSNAGGSQLLIGASVSNVGAFAVTPNFVSLAPGESAMLTARFTPKEPGAQTATLTLANNTVTSPTTISLSGQGRAVPIFYQSTASIDFGEQPVGGGALQRVFISNIGHAPLDVTIDEVATQFSLAGFSATIEPGDSRQLFVTFRPDAVNTFTDSITITSNDDFGSHEIDLSGSGALQRWWVQRDSGSTIRSMTGNWAVGDNGTLLTRFTNDGESWVPRLALGNINLSRIFASNSSGFGATYAVGRSGTLLELSGNSWTPVADPVVAFGGNQFLGGATYWPSNLLMLVGENGVMVRESGFDTYTEVNSGTFEDLHDVAFIPQQQIGVAVGSDGTMLRTTNGGASWLPVSLPAGVNAINLTLRSIEFSTAGVGLIVGDFGNIFRSPANGLNWTKITSPTTATLHDVKFDQTADVYISGSAGTFMKSANAGSSWEIEGTLAANKTLYGVNVYESAVWTVGQGGFIQHRPIEAPEGPVFNLSQGMLDFGTIGVGSTKRMQVTVHNRGNDTLEISSITGDGSLFTPSPSSMTIPPGGQGVVSVVFHPASATDTEPNNPTRVIRFNTNMERVDHYMQVRGVARTSAWMQTASATGEHLLDVQFPTSSIGYAIHSDGVIKTTDGGETWAELTNVNPTGAINAMHWLTSTTGVIVGGNGNAPWGKRTTNGGASWINVSFSGVSGPVIDVSFAAGEDSRGYAVTAQTTSGNTTTSGMVIRTLNAGATWTATPISRPGSFLSGAAVYSFNPFGILASSAGNVYRSINSGSSWDNVFELGGAFNLSTIHTVGIGNGFLGGTGGILRRTTDTDAKTPDWDGVPTFSGRDIRDLHFITQDRGWAVTGGSGIGSAAAIYRTEDAGISWKEEFTIDDGSFNGVFGVGSSGDLAFAVGTDGRIWKYQLFTPEPKGVASVPAFVTLTDAAPGETIAASVEIANLGNADLNILEIVLEDASDIEAFAVGLPTGDTLAPGESKTIEVSFSAADPGNYSATLTFVTDGVEPLSISEIDATVIAEPQVVILDTEPTGLEVVVDGQTYVAPVAFTVISDASASNEWEPGSSHSISVEENRTIGSVDFAFQSWEPANDREFTLTALSTESPRLTARFVEADSQISAQAVAASFHAANVGPPNDLPAGPWIRISDASLAVPALGDIAISGSLFITPEQFSAALESAAFRIPESTATPELLEVSAGSWNVDYANVSGITSVSLRANTPGVELFNIPAAPPSQLVFEFESDGDFEASFATLGDTPVLPGVFTIGPSSIAVERANGFHSLDLSGGIRLLQTPAGDWAYDQTASFSASEGPFTHNITGLPDPILNLGFTSLDTDTSSAIQISRDTSGAFGVALNNFDFTLFGRSFANLSGSADTSGLVTFSASPPATPFAIGPIRLDVSNDTDIEWNVKTGALSVDLPASILKASGVTGWPSAGVAFPAFSVDSDGDFDKKINLPSFTFDGISISSGGGQTDNYLRLKRQDGVVSVKVRDERDFFGNDFKLALDVASSGAVSGSFSGGFSVDTSYFGRLNFGSISLSYDSSASSYQFANRLGLVGNDFAIEFGSSGARFRHLNCDGPDLEDCETGLFSIAP